MELGSATNAQRTRSANFGYDTGIIHALMLNNVRSSCRRSVMKVQWLLVLLLTLSIPTPSVGQARASSQEIVQTSWRLLDYLAVDYSGAVQDGRVVSESEYAEMREFSDTVERQLETLPSTREKASLRSQSAILRRAIETKAPADGVAQLARKLGANLLRAYPVPLAPTALPDLARGTQLYAQNCASCHGAAGDGDGPAAVTLNPRPINFTDRSRAKERSIFALEQVISQGLDGTAMQSFANLPSEDRWALAFKVGTFAYPAEATAQGRRIWDTDASVRAKVPDLAALAGLTPQSLTNEIGLERATAVMAYLRSNPGAVQQSSNGGSLGLTRQRLAQAVNAYRAGDAGEAKRLALSAYLDGFEPVEPMLAARDNDLMRRIEKGMGEFRARISRGVPADDLQAQAQVLDGLFAEAESALAPEAGNSASTFVSALTILLREGVEALLIVIAMIAFLRKADRNDSIKFVHGGWVSALAVGLVTWFVATTLISVSGASRELTEGFGGIFAAFVLVFVGIWMHGKANAEAWQRYVREKIDRALSRGSGWFLFGLAFIVVYREVFETILFYAAMWKDSPAALLAGVILGTVLLGVIAWAMLRYSQKLPIAEFFRYSSALMAVLAVILAGKGVAAIQEAGLVGIAPVHGVPTIDALGVHPSLQVLVAQLIAIAVLFLGFWLNGRRAAVR